MSEAEMMADVFPAHAGMIPGIETSQAHAAGVPRACGDDPVGVQILDSFKGCSPRMRG